MMIFSDVIVFQNILKKKKKKKKITYIIMCSCMLLSYMSLSIHFIFHCDMIIRIMGDWDKVKRKMNDSLSEALDWCSLVLIHYQVHMIRKQ